MSFNLFIFGDESKFIKPIKKLFKYNALFSVSKFCKVSFSIYGILNNIFFSKINIYTIFIIFIIFNIVVILFIIIHR